MSEVDDLSERYLKCAVALTSNRAHDLLMPNEMNHAAHEDALTELSTLSMGEQIKLGAELVFQANRRRETHKDMGMQVLIVRTLESAERFRRTGNPWSLVNARSGLRQMPVYEGK